LKAQLILVCFLVVGGIPSTTSADDPPLCSVTVEVFNGTKVVPITGHRSGAISIPANLSIHLSGSNNTTITLVADLTTNWPVSVSPQVFIVNESTNRTINIVAIVPPGERVNTRANLTLRVMAVNGANTCARFTVQGPTLLPSPYLELLDIGAGSYIEAERTPAGAATELNITCVSNAPVHVELRYLSNVLNVTGPASIDIPWEQLVRGDTVIPIQVRTSDVRPGVHTLRVNATASVEGARPLSMETVVFVRVGAGEEAFIGAVIAGAVIGAVGVIGSALYLQRARTRI
jgi:hypothetical protein